MEPYDPTVVRPWEWNIPLELYILAALIIITAAIFFATRMGRDRKSLGNEMGRHVEDFAGLIQESNAPLPWFLVAFYVIVATGMAGYLLVTLLSGYRY